MSNSQKVVKYEVKHDITLSLSRGLSLL